MNSSSSLQSILNFRIDCNSSTKTVTSENNERRKEERLKKEARNDEHQ